jgi:hypothetical protein
MIMDIGETISVIASFGLPYKIRPMKFKWNRRLFEVKEITYYLYMGDKRRTDKVLSFFCIRWKDIV